MHLTHPMRVEIFSGLDLQCAQAFSPPAPDFVIIRGQTRERYLAIARTRLRQGTFALSADTVGVKRCWSKRKTPDNGTGKAEHVRGRLCIPLHGSRLGGRSCSPMRRRLFRVLAEAASDTRPRASLDVFLSRSSGCSQGSGCYQRSTGELGDELAFQKLRTARAYCQIANGEILVRG